jgi:hypothetical protein
MDPPLGYQPSNRIHLLVLIEDYNAQHLMCEITAAAQATRPLNYLCVCLGAVLDIYSCLSDLEELWLWGTWDVVVRDVESGPAVNVNACVTRGI